MPLHMHSYRHQDDQCMVRDVDTCIRKPPADRMLVSLLIETPSANAEFVCSLSARYLARSSATSPVAMGIMPW